MSDADDARPPRGREARLRGFARRLFREMEGAEEPPEPEAPSAKRPPPEEEPHEGHRAEAWAMLSALLETGDKAKTEIVRLVAREVRSYLEALELHKDLHHLVTNYSLEVHASLHLKPLREDTAAPPSTVGVGLARRTEAPAADRAGPADAPPPSPERKA
jgi:hypothetical protein